MSGSRGVRKEAADARALTDVITQLRRALRRSIRSDYPWESRPVAQVELLQALADSGQTRVGDLAARLRLAQSTVSTLLGRLIEIGLVTRGIDAGDRRAAVVELTADGKEQLKAWDLAHQRRFAQALRALDAADEASIGAALPALRRLVAALEQVDV